MLSCHGPLRLDAGGGRSRAVCRSPWRARHPASRVALRTQVAAAAAVAVGSSCRLRPSYDERLEVASRCARHACRAVELLLGDCPLIDFCDVGVPAPRALMYSWPATPKISLRSMAPATRYERAPKCAGSSPQAAACRFATRRTRVDEVENSCANHAHVSGDGVMGFPKAKTVLSFSKESKGLARTKGASADPCAAQLHRYEGRFVPSVFFVCV